MKRQVLDAEQPVQEENFLEVVACVRVRDGVHVRVGIGLSVDVHVRVRVCVLVLADVLVPVRVPRQGGGMARVGWRSPWAPAVVG